MEPLGMHSRAECTSAGQGAVPASIPAWQWRVSGVSEPRVHRSIVSAHYSIARLRANPDLFQENVLVAPIFTDCEGCCRDSSFALWV